MECFQEIEGALASLPQEASGVDQPSSDPTEQAATRGWTEPVAFEYQQYNDKDFTEWAGNATRYEWKDEYGDVGPRNEELEKQLFQAEYLARAGQRLDR